MSETKEKGYRDENSQQSKELMSRLFPERTEKEKIKSLERSDTIGAVKAHLVMEHLFSS